MNIKALAILSLGHLVTDLNQGALPALLPCFKEALRLSYTTAGTLLMIGNFTSSVIQPAFGYFADRHPARSFLTLTPLIAGAGLAFSGFVSSYTLLLMCVVISGIGVASFHPEGYRTAYHFTGEKKAQAMAIFSFGGNLGMALGPVWALALVAHFGLKGTSGIVLPGILMVILFLSSPRLLAPPDYLASMKQGHEKRSALPRKNLIALGFLISTVIVRSWVQMGLITYIPFYTIDYLKGDPLYAGKLVSTFLLAGALGTLLGGPLADRWGHKKFIFWGLVLTTPLLVLFYVLGGWFAFVALGLAGMILISSFSVSMVMAQALLPQYLGMTSGLLVGFAVGTGGIGVTLLGVIADHWGVPAAMKSIFFLPLIGCGLLLPVRYPPESGTVC